MNVQYVVPASIYHRLYEPRGSLKATVLLMHGMQEHCGRYVEFAEFLQSNGYAVLTYDHAGHGLTAKSKVQLGFFRRSQPDRMLVSDARKIANVLLQRYPGVPLILMGHSMGSFIGRILVDEAAHLFHAAVFIGSGGPNSMASLAKPALYIANAIAPAKRSKWLNKLFISIQNECFKNEVPNDGTNWLSVSMANREAFVNDELCGVDFSNNALYGLISLNVAATRSGWALNIPKEFSMLFVSGDDDPVGDFGKGIEKTAHHLQQRGYKKVDVKRYANMRHEVLNEANRQEVFDDIIQWLGETFPHNKLPPALNLDGD